MRAINRKIRSEKGITRDPGFPEMGPLHYLEALGPIHEALNPQAYLEIGTESGASLHFSKCRSIAIDPNFQLQVDANGERPETHFFQMTSDEFFAKHKPSKLIGPIDLAFLDGMHLFEYLLRDFINVEKHMAPGGCILLHDCVPITHAAAERDWDKEKTSHWTGDVWKLIPILKDYRPDLKVTVYDLAPSGLVAITDLNPKNTSLEKARNEIDKKFGGPESANLEIESLIAAAAIKHIKSGHQFAELRSKRQYN